MLTAVGDKPCWWIGLDIHSFDVVANHRRPSLPWVLCPLVLYWYLRLWALRQRGQAIEDRLVFAWTDRWESRRRAWW